MWRINNSITYTGDTYISPEPACRYTTAAETPNPTPSLPGEGPQAVPVISLCAPDQESRRGGQAPLEQPECSPSPAEGQDFTPRDMSSFFKAQLGFRFEGDSPGCCSDTDVSAIAAVQEICSVCCTLVRGGGQAGWGRNTRGGVLCTVVSAVRASATPPEITWDTTDIYM